MSGMSTNRPPRSPSLDGLTCTEALAANGYGHGDNRSDNLYRRPIYSLETGEVVANLSASGAWDWMAAGCPRGGL